MHWKWRDVRIDCELLQQCTVDSQELTHILSVNIHVAGSIYI